MKWLVQLELIEGTPRLISDLLAAFGLKLHEAGGKPFLQGEMLDAYETASDVRKAAAEVVRAIERATEQHERPVLLKLGTIINEVGASGELLNHHVMVALTGQLVSVGMDAVVAVEEKPLTPEEEQEKAEQQYVELLSKAITSAVSAYRSEDAAIVQLLLRAELTPQRMRFISDILEEGIGTQARHTFALKDEWARFDKSICDRRVMGLDAVHGSPTPGPGYKPMSRSEAQEFIRIAAWAWLKHVASRQSAPRKRAPAPHV